MSTQWNPSGKRDVVEDDNAMRDSLTDNNADVVVGLHDVNQDDPEQDAAGIHVDDASTQPKGGNALSNVVANHKPAVFAGLGLTLALVVFGIGYAVGGAGGGDEEAQLQATEQLAVESQAPTSSVDESHNHTSTRSLQPRDEGITRTPLDDESDKAKETLSMTSQHSSSPASDVSKTSETAPSKPQGPDVKSEGVGDEQNTSERDVVEINKPFEVAPGFVVAVSEPYLLSGKGLGDVLCVKTAYANKTGRIMQFDTNYWRMRTPKGSTLLPPVQKPDATQEGLAQSPIENNEALDADVCFDYFDVGRYQFVYDNPTLEKVMTWQATF